MLFDLLRVERLEITVRSATDQNEDPILVSSSAPINLDYVQVLAQEQTLNFIEGLLAQSGIQVVGHSSLCDFLTLGGVLHPSCELIAQFGAKHTVQEVYVSLPAGARLL
jgi:hypothetical protein